MNIDIPEDPSQDVNWPELRTALLYRRTALVDELYRINKLLTKIDSILDAPKIALSSQNTESSTSSLVLQALNAAPGPIPIASIISTIQNHYPLPISYNSIILALYRLSRKNFIYRQGSKRHYLYSLLKPLPTAPDPPAPPPDLPIP